MNSKKKGNQGQTDFANFMSGNGFRCQSDGSRSGGGEWKGDVRNDLDMSIEVKTVSKINLHECWKQTERDALTSRATPILAVHFDYMPQGSWLMVMHSEDWMDMLKKAQGVRIPEDTPTGSGTPNRELKWALEQLKNAITKVIKLLE